MIINDPGAMLQAFSAARFSARVRGLPSIPAAETIRAKTARKRRGRRAISGGKESTESIRSAISEIEQRIDDLARALLGTEEFAKTANAASQVQFMVRKGMNDHMSRQLAFFNMPSREDIAALGDRLMSVEERLLAIESLLHSMAPPAPKKAGPPRTKKPSGKKSK